MADIGRFGSPRDGTPMSAHRQVERCPPTNPVAAISSSGFVLTNI